MKFIFKTMTVKPKDEAWVLVAFESSESCLWSSRCFWKSLAQQLRRTHVLQCVSSKVQTLNTSIVLPLLHHKKERKREREKWEGIPFSASESRWRSWCRVFSEPEHHSGTGTGRHLGISIQTITNTAQEELTVKTLSVCVRVLNMNEEECASAWQREGEYCIWRRMSLFRRSSG